MATLTLALPKRTVTVLPPSADFAIAVSPSSKAVLPGQSTTFIVTVTPVTGSVGAISLSVGSEAGLPAGITSGGFNPSSIPGAGGSSTLTMNTTTSANPYALSLTITGTAGSITHTASTTLLVNLAPPATLTATGGSGQVSLSWPASIGATGYHVKRALVSGGLYVSISCPTTTTYTDPGLGGGTTYYYVVSASYTSGPDAGGESADSPEASATVGALSLSAAPTNVVASRGNPRGSVSIQWTQSTTAGVTQNYVYRQSSNGTYPSTPTAKISPTTSYVDTRLVSGTAYCYAITALNGPVRIRSLTTTNRERRSHVLGECRHNKMHHRRCQTIGRLKSR
jgi:hypothetical protein